MRGGYYVLEVRDRREEALVDSIVTKTGTLQTTKRQLDRAFCCVVVKEQHENTQQKEGRCKDKMNDISSKEKITTQVDAQQVYQ